MSRDVHRLDNQKGGVEIYKWPKYFKIFFFANLIFLICFFCLSYILSSPSWFLVWTGLGLGNILEILLFLIPALFTLFIMLPLIVKKYYSKKNNAILFLFCMVLFISIALLFGIFLEIFEFGTYMLSTFFNQVVFIIILTAMYYYFLFDQEIFHKGFNTLNVKWKIAINLCFILPSSAIFFRVLQFNIYSRAVESIFLGVPTVLFVFYTLSDIIIKSLASSKRVKKEDKIYSRAYIFIGLSTIILFLFFIIFACFILFEWPRDSLFYYFTLMLLSIVVLLLYLGYIWPSRKKEG